MLMVGFRGLTLRPDDPIREAIASHRLGNTVVYDYDVALDSPIRNIEGPEQLRALTQQLQDLAPTPMLIAVDQEGGIITRLDAANGFDASPSHQTLGQIGDPEFTLEAAGAIAASLSTMGLNLNFAPVVDVNVNPDNPIIGGLERSFSADPEEVADQALAYIEAHHERGVLCTLKHFPGHGSSLDDSHEGFVDVTELWSRDELIPFARIIDAGQADAVMTAHIFNAELDPEYPATLSERTISGILRDEMGYGGVVISDDMQMGAIRDHYGFETAIELAVKAGADIVVVANNTVFDPDAATLAFDTVLSAVAEGRITESRIHESYQRIMSLKQHLL